MDATSKDDETFARYFALGRFQVTTLPHTFLTILHSDTYDFPIRRRGGVGVGSGGVGVGSGGGEGRRRRFFYDSRLWQFFLAVITKKLLPKETHLVVVSIFIV